MSTKTETLSLMLQTNLIHANRSFTLVTVHRRRYPQRSGEGTCLHLQDTTENVSTGATSASSSPPEDRDIPFLRNVVGASH
jgi:hypothetical protein